MLNGKGEIPAVDELGLGRRIRSARTSRSLSLGQVAAATGLTKSLLSQVERGIASPSLTSLRKVAYALQVPISHLLSTENAVGAVLRRSHRKEIRWPALGITYEFVSPDDRTNLQLVLMRLEPGGRNCEEPTGSSTGDECALVLAGTVEVVVGDSRHRLEEGDSITLDRAAPHQYINVGAGPATLVAAMTPASM